MSQTIYQFEIKDIQGKLLPLEQFRGKTLLIVNTASKCGFTPQYEGLEALHQKYKDSGLAVLGFPCNQFGKQEPGDEKEIAKFCDLNFKVSFPMFSKVEVNGENSEPLYDYLKNEATGILGSKSIKWNFTKFLVDNQGKVIKRYAPNDKPESIEKDIQALLTNN